MNQGPIWGQFMKKNSGQKSRATVPLNHQENLLGKIRSKNFKRAFKSLRTNPTMYNNSIARPNPIISLTLCKIRLD